MVIVDVFIAFTKIISIHCHAGSTPGSQYQYEYPPYYSGTKLNESHLENANIKYIRQLREKFNHWVENFSSVLRSRNYKKTSFSQCCAASNGKPFSFDDGTMRSLHFDHKMMQSAMWIDAPNELAFGYTRCMMGFLLFNQNPKQILVLGLGGGSLVKYCYQYLPQSNITAVEIDPNVIALRKHFLIPSDDHRLQIIQMDAAKFVTQTEQLFDVILLDGFDADGLVADLSTKKFYMDCKQKLSSNGILVSNLWGDSFDISSIIAQKCLIFNNSVLWCRSIDSYNIISFSFQSLSFTFDHQLKSIAKILSQRFHLELVQIAYRLITSAKFLKELTSSLFSRKHHRQIHSQDIFNEIDEMLRAHDDVPKTRSEWVALNKNFNE